MIRNVIWRLPCGMRQQLRFFHYSRSILNTKSAENKSTDDSSNNNTVSNISKILNELNDEDDFAARNIRYRTTASQLVEEMGKNQEKPVSLPSNNENEKQLETMSTVVEDEKQEEKNIKKNLVDIERYLHTYDIYQKLRASDFTEQQSNLIMKLILVQIQENVNKMIKKHSPLLDLQNENYLFQLAQQELKSELSSARESDLNLLVSSSILLKRSFQSLEDELVINYKLMDNSIRLELNQFKHENNLHNKQLDLKNQDLNNKIITDLVGELRSYIESLRWQLTRSALLTIFTMVFLAISTYTFIKNNDDDDEEEPKLKLEDIGSKKIIDKMINDKEDDDDEAELELDERL